MIKLSNLPKTVICIINICVIVGTIVLLSSCDRGFGQSEDTSNPGTNIVQKNTRLRKQDQVWERIRKNFDIPSSHKLGGPQNPRIQHFIKQYGEKQLTDMGTKASPYMYYIIDQLEKRNMPGELALLPMIESAFEPGATSKAKAAGLWQFIPSTGKQFGLKQDQYYDARRDVKASTKAALDYLEALHKEFDQNWTLALAAYNAGEGRIRQAIQKNKKKGKATHFWALDLPEETKKYVPKLLALAEVVKNSDKNKMPLPPIENKPYFENVNVGKSVELGKVAKLAEIELKELKRLNAGYKKSATAPNGKGPQELLLPVENANTLKLNMHKIR